MNAASISLLAPVSMLALGAGCGRAASPPAHDAAAGAAVTVPRADAAPAAPITWRGPNRYTLADGAVTVGVSLRPPGGWAEDSTDAHELVTSPSGSTMKVWLVRGRAPAAPTRSARAAHHEHRVPVAGDDALIACDVAVTDADAALLDPLAAQCAGLSFEYEPDDRAAWTLEVEPATVRLAELSTVTVRYRVSNRSTSPLDARAYALTWQVDGIDSMALGMAFGNGGYDKAWHALPSGQAISDERRGVTLVDAPGDHVISIVHLGRELARAPLRVTR